MGGNASGANAPTSGLNAPTNTTAGDLTMGSSKPTWTWMDSTTQPFWIRCKLAVSLLLTPITIVLIGRSIRVRLPEEPRV